MLWMLIVCKLAGHACLARGQRRPARDTLGPAAGVKGAETTLARRGPQISVKFTHLWAGVRLYFTLHSSFPPSYGMEGTRKIIRDPEKGSDVSVTKLDCG